MAKKISKRKLIWIGAGVGLALVAVIGIGIWRKKANALPEGLAAGNGRIEGKLADVSAKEPLRVKKILVDEGTLVKKGQVLVRLDTVTLEAELAEADASIKAAEEKLAVAKATIAKEHSEIKLAATEENRSKRLVQEGAGSQRELDVRTTKVATSKASLGEAQATLSTAEQQVEVARASAQTVQTRIDDATLKSPVNGRVLYRLVEPGEVLGPGGKALTLVNLEDVYMEIFLPAEQAAGLKIGAEARITLDFAPDRVIPAFVSFVSPEAQFTPKQVETKSEREKLMFRVKLQVSQDLAAQFIERVKTGVRGVGYVKVKDSAVWPEKLQKLITAPAAGPVAQ